MSKENPNLEPHGDGFLNVANTTVYPEGAMKPAAPGTCPKCGKAASEWEPPMFDERYRRRVAAIREIQDFQSDYEAHVQYLKETGCFIETCKECGTAFVVPSSVAKVKQ